MNRPPNTAHGTIGGYQKHLRDRTEPCDECRTANNAWHADYRKRNPQSLKQQKRQAELRRRALSRLAERYPDDYAALYAQEALRP